MSIYRFARTTALLTLASRYRVKIWRITFAIAFAAATAWLYGDVAVFVQQQYPHLAWLALFIKTAIVYLALIYCFWQFRTPAAAMPDTERDPEFERLEAMAERELNASSETTTTGKLDRLIDKPELRSRRDDILEG